MSLLYAQHTVGAVFVSQTGHQHVRTEPSDGSPTSLDCVMCEPYLVQEGWVYDPVLVPLTEQQQREQERIEREGNMAVKQVAEALAETAAAALAAGVPSAAGTSADEPVKVKRGPGRPRKNPVTD